jgi:hypothetical protein
MELGAWRTWFEKRGEQDLRELVHAEWDPLVVGTGSPGAYDTYLGTIAAHLHQGGGPTSLATLLAALVTDDMHLASSARREGDAAQLIWEWYADTMWAIDLTGSTGY